MEIDVEEIPIAMMLVQRDFKIHLANKALHDLFGYKNKELNGQELSILLPPYIRAIHHIKAEAYWKEVETTAKPTIRSLGTGRDLYGIKKDGDIVPVEVGLYPYGIYMLVFVIDITTGRKYAMSQSP